MADKTLNDVVDQLKNVNDKLKEPPKSTDAKEAAEEAARQADIAFGVQLDILNALESGFVGGSGKDKKQGGIIAGMLGGLGSGLGGIGKAVASIGKGFGVGLAALGAGIAGFVLALGAAAVILEMMNPDSSVLVSVISNFFDAFTEENAIKMGVLVVIAGVMAGFGIKPLIFAGMMTAIGAGIAGFAGGILIGSAISKYGLTLMGGLDGGALATLLSSFFGAMTPTAAAGVGVLVTMAGLLSKLEVTGLQMATMMTGLGAGIAGFAGGILIGSALTKYGLAAMGGLDAGALANLLDGFFTSITPAVAVGLGVMVTLAGIANRMGIDDLKGALSMSMGMTAIGLGIAGFSLGILLGDGAAKLGEMADLDGTSLATLLKNFMGAFNGVGFVALGALITAGAVLGTALGPAALLAVPIGMGAIGLGIAAFLLPLMGADFIAGLMGDNAGGNLATLLTNIGKGIGGFLGGFAGETFKQMEKIDGDKLAQIGKGILDLGTGMIAFAGGRAAGGIADAFGAIGNLFGEKKGPLHTFAEISKDKSIDANRLSELGTGISDLALGLKAFAAVDSTGLAANALTTGLITGMGNAKDGVSGMFDSTTGMVKKLLADTTGLATGGLVTPRSAGIFQLHQGEMVLDNAAVAAFSKSLNLMNMSQENAMAGMGGGQPIIVNNTNVDNSMKSSQTTAVSMPAPTRSNESTLRALQMN